MSTITNPKKTAPSQAYVADYGAKLRAEWFKDAAQQAATAPLTQQAIKNIYADLGLAEPLVIWCDSMLQFCNMPWLISLFCQCKDPGSRSDFVKRFKTIKRTKNVPMVLRLGDKFLEYAKPNLPEDLGPLLNGRLIQTLIKELSSDLATETVTLIGEREKSTLQRFIRWAVFRFTDRLQNSPATWIQSAAFGKISESPDIYSLPGDTRTKAEAVEEYQEDTPSRRLAPSTVFRNAWSANDLYWLANYDCLRTSLDYSFEPRIDKQLTEWMTLLRSSFAYLFFENVCFVCAYPRTIVLDDSIRLHNETDAAFIGADGQKYYFWHGTHVKEWTIKYKKLITPLIIDLQENTETRRVMTEIYGWDRYFRKTKTIKVHQDECGALYRKDFKRGDPAVFVEVLNSTPEPDGTSKKYLLRVPPTMRTARAAVAWTFGLEADEYEPTEES